MRLLLFSSQEEFHKQPQRQKSETKEHKLSWQTNPEVRIITIFVLPLRSTALQTAPRHSLWHYKYTISTIMVQLIAVY